MAELLVDLSRTMGPPSYVEQERYMNLSALLPSKTYRGPDDAEDFDGATLQNVDIMGRWPVAEGSQLDSSQMAAVRRILSKKVAIVQGPPGTGMKILYTSLA